MKMELWTDSFAMVMSSGRKEGRQSRWLAVEGLSTRGCLLDEVKWSFTPSHVTVCSVKDEVIQ